MHFTWSVACSFTVGQPHGMVEQVSNTYSTMICLLQLWFSFMTHLHVTVIVQLGVHVCCLCHAHFILWQL